MSLPRIVISAPKSGSGKTFITLSLIKAFFAKGKRVRSFKCGPDFIDPMFHRHVLGVPSKNLDEYFCGDDIPVIRSVFAEQNDAEISLIEGVMGLYDGISSASEKGSTYSLAKSLCAPIVLVVDAKGMARSVLAEIAGFVSMDSAHLIKGIILNNTGLNVYSAVKQEIEERFAVKMLGYFPPQKKLELKSRYLGLILPDEIADLSKKIEKAASQLARTVDLDEIMCLARSAPELNALSFMSFNDKPLDSPKPRVALARDEAFCFYYEDNLRILKELGAQIVEFSPVHDKELPENISGIVLGGGYPELFADQLEENKSMRASVKAALESGIPSIAECGGFIYLHDTLQTQDGRLYKMAGVIPGRCFYTGKLVRFGYMALREKKNIWLDGKEIRGHEFHYFDSTDNGTDAFAQKPVTEKSWDCAHISASRWWGFAHLYYGSNWKFAEHFIKECERYSPRNFKPFDLGEEIKRMPKSPAESENYKFFQNTKCEKFPCHAGVASEDFNCLFCYCPLYALGEDCGGNFEIKKNGIKSCINCNFPHKRENYEKINARFGEIAQLIKNNLKIKEEKDEKK